MKTIKLPIPDDLAKHLDGMVKQGLFESKESAILFAVTRLVENPMAAIAQRLGLPDVQSILREMRTPAKRQKAMKPVAKDAPLKIYELKITLDGIKPPIWRRFQVRSDSKLTRLHNILLDVMGWSGYHLYEFRIGGLSYTDPQEVEEDEYDRNLQNGAKVQLSQVMEKIGDKITYMYDFGDGWQHTIQLEKILDPVPGEKYPICIAGARSCPPEDCGGEYGYADLLKTLADPNDPEHEDMKEWVGPYFDPEKFLLEAVNGNMIRRVAVKES